jgi:hypothetical protein
MQWCTGTATGDGNMVRANSNGTSALTMNGLDELTDKNLDEVSGGWGLFIVVRLGLSAQGTGSETHDPKLKNQSTKI